MATLGIDLGGTFARAAVVDAEGKLLAAAKTALVDRTPSAVVEAIAEAAATAVKLGGPVSGCGVGAAAQIKHDSGVLAVAPNLGWRDVPLGAMLAERLGQRVKVVNDLSAAAWGELHAGAGRGAQDLFVCFVGSGVGSAIIANGQLVHGSGGVAGEFGHIKVVRDGRLCGCGERGCLEAYCGGHNFIVRIRALLASGASPGLTALTGGDPARVTPVTLELAAEQGDAAARALHDETCQMLAMAVANQVTVLNPARLILGGGVLTHCPEMRRRVAEGVLAWASVVSREGLGILDAELGDDSGLIGAALLA